MLINVTHKNKLIKKMSLLQLFSTLNPLRYFMHTDFLTFFWSRLSFFKNIIIKCMAAYFVLSFLDILQNSQNMDQA